MADLSDDDVRQWREVVDWINARRSALLDRERLVESLNYIEDRADQRGHGDGMHAARNVVRTQFTFMERLIESAEKYGQKRAARFLQGGVSALRVIHVHLGGDDANPS